MPELPWFRVYPAEMLSDEHFTAMSMAERGAWFTLVAMCWKEGSIPSDLDRLSRILHLDREAMGTLWAAIGDRFAEMDGDPSRLVSPRLERERKDAKERHQKAVESGKNGANARWNGTNSPDSNPMGTLSPAHSKQQQDQDQIQNKAAARRGWPGLEKLAAALTERWEVKKPVALPSVKLREPLEHAIEVLGFETVFDLYHADAVEAFKHHRLENPPSSLGFSAEKAIQAAQSRRASA